MAGFEDVDLMGDQSNHSLVFEADERHTMECADPTAPPYYEPNPAPLEDCSWRVPVYAAGECKAMPGTDSDREKRPESFTVRTRTGVGEPNVVLNRPVLREKALRQLTSEQTAKELGVSLATLKKYLRKLDIQDWRIFCEAP